MRKRKYADRVKLLIYMLKITSRGPRPSPLKPPSKGHYLGEFNALNEGFSHCIAEFALCPIFPLPSFPTTLRLSLHLKLRSNIIQDVRANAYS